MSISSSKPFENQLSLNVAVYFSSEELGSYPFNVPGYRNSYIDFFNTARKVSPHVEFYIVRGQSYAGHSAFSYGQKFDFDSQKFVSIKAPFHADIIYNKGDFLVASDDEANIVNHPKFDRLCKDKMRTALLFPEYSPASIEVENDEQLAQAAQRMPSSKIIMKPLKGQEGKGIQIFESDELDGIEVVEPSIVQEFLDTSEGIEGVVDSLHDLRILLMNGEIVQIYVREPSEGKEISNVSKGGSLKEIDKKELPEDILDICSQVDQKLNRYFPRIYSIDFGYTEEGPKIFELNSQPGLPYPQWKKYYHFWHQKLWETLLLSLKKK